MKAAKVECTIVQNGDPVLRAKAKPVPKSEFGGKGLRGILKAMHEALEQESDGVALAAPQIGVSLRMFIISPKAFLIDDEHKEGGAPAKKIITPKIPLKDLVCINPEIIKHSRKKVSVPEGCLSVRWLYGNTLRYEKATLRAYDEHGKRFTYGGAGLIAQIFQHETDHLEGTLFVDHATAIEELTPAEIKKIQKNNER